MHMKILNSHHNSTIISIHRRNSCRVYNDDILEATTCQAEAPSHIPRAQGSYSVKSPAPYSVAP